MPPSFDAEGFRAAGKEKGWSDEFIQKQIDTHTAGLKGPATQPTKADVQTGSEYDWLVPAALTAVGAEVARRAVDTDTAKKMFGSLKEMFGSKKAESFEKMEPFFSNAPQGATVEQPEYTPRKFTSADVTDVASRPVGTERAQLPGPRQQPAAATPQAAPTGVPSVPPQFTVAGQPQAQMQYGATAYNQPTGTPSPLAPVTPPGEANTAVAPLTDKQRREKAQADLAELRLEEAKKKSAAEEAKRAETKIQASQGTPASDANLQLLKQSEENKLDKANVSQQQAVAKQKAAIAGAAGPAATPPAAAPTPSAPVQLTPAPEVMAEAPVAKPVAPAPEKVAAAEKSALKWPGGSEGSALQQFFGATKKTLTPEHMAGLEMFKDYIGGELAPSTGGTIKEIGKANEFVTKYSGKPLPVGENGKLQRLPEQQIADIHAGIRSELETAVKGGKLSTLSKGAMAAVGLLGLTGAVQAAQKGDFGPLKEAGFDIGGPVAAGKLGLGLLSKAGGLGFSALTYAGAAGEANEKAQVAKRFAESQKLGSPYRSVPPPR